MKKFSICVLIMTFIVQVPYAISALKDNLGIGFNVGAQRIYGDSQIRPAIDLGGEGLLNYAIRRNKFGFNVGLGYSWLKCYHRTRMISTDLVTLDFKALFFPLPFQAFNPYACVGVGIINFRYPLAVGERYYDGSFIIGGGIEWLINPQLGFNSTIDYRYTTGDDFDGVGGGTTDGYLNARIGLTYYFSPRDKAIPVGDELSGIDAAFKEGIENADDQNQSDYTVDEFVILKSRVEELTERITEKESEITELKTLIDSRKEKITEIEKMGPRPRPAITPAYPPSTAPPQEYAVSDDFSAAYESGLERFYAHDYDGTISIMGGLLQKDAQNRLASNCQYWIGESYFGKRDYQNAVAAFEQVLAYPNSPKLDDALLMLGKSYLNSGDAENAKRYFSQLVQEFPESEYVEKAESYLGNL